MNLRFFFPGLAADESSGLAWLVEGCSGSVGPINPDDRLILDIFNLELD